MIMQFVVCEFIYFFFVTNALACTNMYVYLKKMKRQKKVILLDHRRFETFRVQFTRYRHEPFMAA